MKFLQHDGQDDDLSSTGQRDEPNGDREPYKAELGPRPDLARDLASPSQHKLQRERRYSSTMNTARDRNPRTPLAQESAHLADFEESSRSRAHVQSPSSALPGGVDLDEMQSMKTGLSTQYNIEQIDQIQELLSMNLQSYGFPDCGNLRSTKRKDVRCRLNCIQAMLKQRIKDIQFREEMKNKGRVTESTET